VNLPPQANLQFRTRPVELIEKQAGSTVTCNIFKTQKPLVLHRPDRYPGISGASLNTSSHQGKTSNHMSSRCARPRLHRCRRVNNLSKPMTVRTARSGQNTLGAELMTSSASEGHQCRTQLLHCSLVKHVPPLPPYMNADMMTQLTRAGFGTEETCVCRIVPGLFCFPPPRVRSSTKRQGMNGGSPAFQDRHSATGRATHE
jgi:hypothetical protein